MMYSIRRFESLIMGCAEETILLQETDSASANERLYNHRLNLSEAQEDTTLREWMVCHSHQANLCETSLVGSSHPRLISDFFP